VILLRPLYKHLSIRTECFLKSSYNKEASRAAIAAAAKYGNPIPVEFKFSGSTALAVLARLEQVSVSESRDDSTIEDSSSAVQITEEPDMTSDLVFATRLYIAHAGDCRAVLSHAGVAVDMTRDHKPGVRPDEVQRIEAAGGWVHNGRLRTYISLGCYASRFLLYLLLCPDGVLAVSRAFGDAEHKTLKERFWEQKFSADPLSKSCLLVSRSSEHVRRALACCSCEARYSHSYCEAP